MACGLEKFRIFSKADVGRCLVASKNLQPLVTILDDQPAVIGPDQSVNYPVCLVCYKKIVNPQQQKCEKCFLPMCNNNNDNDSQDCHSIYENLLLHHSQAECRIFSQRKILLQNPIPLMKCILPLRLVLLKYNNRDLYETLMKLMDHNESRKKNQEIWKFYQDHVVDYLRTKLKLGDIISVEDLNRSIGIIRTNCIETSLNDQICRSLYPTMSLLSHSCLSNARCVKQENCGIQIVSQTSINQDEDIFISYISLLLSTRRRRESLKKNWFFDCFCPRCSSPTELGTNLGTLKCSECDEGWLTSQNSLDNESCLQCNKCSQSMSVEIVDKLENDFEKEIMKIEDSLTGMEIIYSCQKLLQQMSKKFHPHHYLNMRCKSQLIAHLGNIPGCFYHQMDKDQLIYKITLCNEFLEVFTLVDMGATDWRGSTLFELAMTRVSLAQRNLDSKLIKATEFRDELSKVVEMFDECMEILSPESEESYAKDIYKRARRSRLEVRDIIRFAEFLN